MLSRAQLTGSRKQLLPSIFSGHPATAIATDGCVPDLLTVGASDWLKAATSPYADLLSSTRRACSALLGEVWQCHLLRTPVALRLTASVWTGVEVSSCAEAKEAIRKCNRCKYLKNSAKWIRRLVYRDGDVWHTWLCEAPITQAWGLGCKICRAKCANPEQSSSPFIRLTKGSTCREAPPMQFMGFTLWASQFSCSFAS